MNSSSISVKGVVLRELVAWLESNSGQAASERLFAGLSRDVQALLDPKRELWGMLPASWYPSTLHHQVLEGMFGDEKPNSPRVAMATDALMKATLKGIYASLFKQFATPTLYSRYADKMWRMYNNNGECCVSLLEAGLAVTEVRDWPGHHPIACDMNRLAGEFIFKAMDCRQVRLERTHCISTGAPSCRALIHWAA
ncbi:MAG: hypothetical protein QM756_35000 [Polyangiaceae bacterium]